MGIIFRGIPPRLAIRLRNKYKLKWFIETGTFTGKTTAWAGRNFDQVLSIEYSKKHFIACRKGLKSYKNIKLFKGSSGERLGEMLAEINSPALIWLDAHWSRDLGYGRPEFGECPILAELDAIIKDGRKHIILIDDARYFLGRPAKPHIQNQWPTFNQIEKKLGKRVYVETDVIVVE